jgi:DNA-binding CsgD family transcriptional regulator
MPIINSQLNLVSSAPRSSDGAKSLRGFPENLLATVRRWSVSEVGATTAHELNEPLTALRLYLHEIKQEIDRSSEPETVGVYTQDIVEKALGEMERVCSIVARIGEGIEMQLDQESAVASGREVINWWTRNNTPRGSNPRFSAPALPRQHLLTPREREVLDEISLGSSNKEGGYRLGISPRTFEAHRAQIKRKLRARNTVDLVRMALGEGR